MNPTLSAFLRVLNEAQAADPVALNALLNHRVECNAKLADHPTIQVRPMTFSGRAIVTKSDLDRCEVGALGLLNGLIEATTGERIAAVWDDNDKLIGFIQYVKP